MIEFGQYLPDLPDYENPGCTVAKNVIPHAKGYRSFPSATVYSDALTDRALGAIVAKNITGTVYHYAADKTKLYVLSGTSWQDVSRATGYSVNTDEQWSFMQYSNRLYAANFYDETQFMTLGDSTFADSTAPRCRYMGNIFNFLVCANTYDSTDGAVPNRVWWSAIDDPTNWPDPRTDAATAASVQSGLQDLGSGGTIQGIVSGEYGVILQEKAIWRMQYEDPPIVFGFYQIENSKGTFAPKSIASWGSLVFYLSEDGFYMFDGQMSHPIGHNRVDNTLFSEIDRDYFYKISATVDPEEQTVMWAVPVTGHTDGWPNKIYLYNWKSDRWAFIDDTADILVSAATPTTTLEELDALFPSGVETVTPSFDSPRWSRGAPRLSAIKSDKKLHNYIGTAMASTIETSEYGLNKNRRTSVQRVKPIVDGGTTTVAVGTRNALSDTVAWGSDISLNTQGESLHRNSAFYHRFRIKTTGGFNHSQGVDLVEAQDGGKR